MRHYLITSSRPCILCLCQKKNQNCTDGQRTSVINCSLVSELLGPVSRHYLHRLPDNHTSTKSIISRPCPREWLSKADNDFFKMPSNMIFLSVGLFYTISNSYHTIKGDVYQLNIRGSFRGKCEAPQSKSNQLGLHFP